MRKGKIMFTVWLAVGAMLVSLAAGFIHNVSFPVIIIRVLTAGFIFAGIGLSFCTIWEAFSDSSLNNSFMISNEQLKTADDSNFKETLGKKIDFRLEQELPEPITYDSIIVSSVTNK